MVLKWTVEMVADFPDDEIDRICDLMRQEGYDPAVLCREILEVVMGFEDDVYYTWDAEQTKAVINEVKRRLGGVQLNMFEEGVI